MVPQEVINNSVGVDRKLLMAAQEHKAEVLLDLVQYSS